jgi:hypothetical protein
MDEARYQFRIIISKDGNDDCMEPCTRPFVNDAGVLIFEQIVDGREYNYGYKHWDFFESYLHNLEPGWGEEFEEFELEEHEQENDEPVCVCGNSTTPPRIRPRSKRGEDYDPRW